MEIGKLIIFQILISSGKLKMQEMHCILLVFYIGATFFCAREAWEMLYFTCTSLPSAAARDAAAVALRGSERGMAKMERSGN